MSQASNRNVETRGPASPRGSSAGETAPVRVFLVDDQAMVSEAIRRALSGERDIEFHCTPAASNAIDLAGQIKPTVILQDLVMPGSDGMTLVRQYRENEATKDIPVIVLSSNENPETKSRAFADGANDYLVKLPDRVELIARIRYHSRSYSNLLQRNEAVAALQKSQRELVDKNQQLTALNKKLEEATLAKSEFLANMSHEIRAPLNNVIGMTTLLADTALTDDQREYVETTRNSSDALLAIINDVLDFSKIEAGRLELERHPFELYKCIEESLDLVAAGAAEKGLDLAYHLDDAIPRILTNDVTRLRQILVNLVGNAVKFTSKGEVVITARVASEELYRESRFVAAPDRWLLHLSVRDTGIGIPREKQHRLFTTFQQADVSTARHHGGTGLGLAICKRLVELMGGRIWVESAEDLGATFHFTLPSQALASSSTSEWKLPQSELNGRRILFVEDHQVTREVFEHHVKQWGALPTCATDGASALQLVTRSRPFDVVVLDLQLPDTPGFELATAIRNLPAGKRLPIILLTSQRVRSDDRRPARSGISSFLNKPLRLEQLLQALFRALKVGSKTQRKAPAKPVLDAAFASRLPMRLLLADDNATNRKVGLHILQKLGYDARVAANGNEVLRALESEHYDLLLIDLQMPEMNGLEAARRIRAHWPENRRPRIIALTGNALLGDREKCLAAGMDDHITKPIRVAELKSVLERWAPGTRSGD